LSSKDKVDLLNYATEECAVLGIELTKVTPDVAKFAAAGTLAK
jgi:hypothetical protein